jgi:hypothetical protein
MNMRFVPIALLAFWSAPALGEPIGKLAAGAFCRDENGVVRPNVKPPEHAEANRAPNGMIKTDDKVDGGDCYLYRSEAVLAETPPPCPSASVGKPDSHIAGTLGPTSCNDR